MELRLIYFKQLKIKVKSKCCDFVLEFFAWLWAFERLQKLWYGSSHFCTDRYLDLGLRGLNLALRLVSGNLRDGACFKLDKQTWLWKKQSYTEDDFSKSTH